MKHKMIHYLGYFLLALGFVFAGAALSTIPEIQAYPFFVLGFAFWMVGCIKVAKRNSILKNSGDL